MIVRSLTGEFYICSIENIYCEVKQNDRIVLCNQKIINRINYDHETCGRKKGCSYHLISYMDDKVL
jgi:hypothetical protein